MISESQEPIIIDDKKADKNKKKKKTDDQSEHQLRQILIYLYIPFIWILTLVLVGLIIGATDGKDSWFGEPEEVTAGATIGAGEVATETEAEDTEAKNATQATTDSTQTITNNATQTITNVTQTLTNVTQDVSNNATDGSVDIDLGTAATEKK